MNSYAAATSCQVNSRWLASPPPPTSSLVPSPAPDLTPNPTSSTSASSCPSRPRPCCRRHLQEVILRRILLLTGIRVQRFLLGIRVQLLLGPRFFSRAVERKKQASLLPAELDGQNGRASSPEPWRGRSRPAFSQLSLNGQPCHRPCATLSLPTAPVAPWRGAPGSRGHHA